MKFRAIIFLILPAVACAATYPADILDLTNWKITLPIGTGTSPTEIKQPALATFSDASYFHLNTTGDGVVFKAHCGGVTTSGSSYPRSELREMISNGTANASWSTSVGTHAMYLRQAITHLPDVKPQVVAGQIHDASSDVIVIRLEGTHLFVDHSGTTGPTLTNNYQLGTIFTAKFVANGGAVKIFYNDATTPADNYAVATTGCYFKAGCYTQSNTTKGDSTGAYGEVVIYDLRIDTTEITTSTIPLVRVLSLGAQSLTSGAREEFDAAGRNLPEGTSTVNPSRVRTGDVLIYYLRKLPRR